MDRRTRRGDPAGAGGAIGSDSTEPGGSPSQTPRRAGIGRNSVWGLISQLAPLAVNVFMTPFVIHGFGIDRYGLFMLALGLATVFLRFDGGLTASAQRYFAIFAGRGDLLETTRLMTTITTLVTGLAVAIAITLNIVADPVTRLLHMPEELRGEAAFLLRMASVTIGMSLIRNVFAAILQAHNRWAVANLTYVFSYPIYVVGIILTVHNHWGLRGAACTIATQQVLTAIVLIPLARQYLDRTGVGFYSRAELTQLLSFSAKMQAVSISNLFLTQVDSLIIGAFLPVKNVAFYAAGSGFADQIRNTPNSILGPIQTRLSHRFGEGGEEKLYEEFKTLQKRWGVGVSGWCAAAVGAAYFGVTSWLGTATTSFRVSGIVATVLLIGAFAQLLTPVLFSALAVAGFPGFEARMSGVMVVVNVTLTACVVWTGPIGVVCATAASQFAAVTYLNRALRRRHPVPIRNVLRDIPLGPSITTAGAVFALEWLIHPLVPYGAAGLLMCAIPAALGLLLYARLTTGRSLRDAVSMLRGR